MSLSLPSHYRPRANDAALSGRPADSRITICASAFPAAQPSHTGREDSVDLAGLRQGDTSALVAIAARLPRETSLHTPEILTAVAAAARTLSAPNTSSDASTEPRVRAKLLEFVLSFGAHDVTLRSPVREIVDYLAERGAPEQIVPRCGRELRARVNRQNLSGYDMIVTLLELTPGPQAEQCLQRLQHADHRSTQTAREREIDPDDDPFEIRPAGRFLACSGIFAMGMANLGAFLKGQNSSDVFLLGLAGFGVGMYLSYGDLKTRAVSTPVDNSAPAQELQRLAAESLGRRRRGAE